MKSTKTQKPILATFLVSTPRSGTFAMSEIFDTKYCVTHHEGNDFNFSHLVRNKGEDIPYESSYSFKVLENCVSQGVNYFCCDQSCGFDLLLAACASPTVQNWIHDGIIVLQIIRMERETVACSFSMVSKVRQAGYIVNPKVYLEAMIQAQQDRMVAVQQHRQLIEEMVGDRIFSLTYESCVDEKLDDIGGQYQLFHYPFLAQTALIVGAAGSRLEDDEDPEEMTQIRVETDPHTDKEEMELILRRAKNKIDVPLDRFKSNIELLDRIYNGEKRSTPDESLQEGKKMNDIDLQIGGFIPPSRMS